MQGVRVENQVSRDWCSRFGVQRSTAMPTRCTSTPYTLIPKPYTLHLTTYTCTLLSIPAPYTPYPTHAPYTFLPTPDTQHPTPCSLHPVPYTPHPAPHTLQPTPFTLHPTPCTLHLHSTPAPYTLLPTPFTLHHTPCTCTLHPTPYTLHPLVFWRPREGRDHQTTPSDRSVCPQPAWRGLWAYRSRLLANVCLSLWAGSGRAVAFPRPYGASMAPRGACRLAATGAARTKLTPGET